MIRIECVLQYIMRHNYHHSKCNNIASIAVGALAIGYGLVGPTPQCRDINAAKTRIADLTAQYDSPVNAYLEAQQVPLQKFEKLNGRNLDWGVISTSTSLDQVIANTTFHINPEYYSDIQKILDADAKRGELVTNDEVQEYLGLQKSLPDLEQGARRFRAYGGTSMIVLAAVIYFSEPVVIGYLRRRRLTSIRSKK